jgi:hypothetical protein
MSANPKDKLAQVAPRSTALAAQMANPINAALANAGYLDAVLQGSANLVSPIFAVDQVPEGTKLSVRMVRVRPDRDCYPLPGGKKALLKTALDIIAGAAQVDWSFSGQVDDWNDPFRVKYHAVAVVRNPDGTLRRLPGTKVVDLRKSAEFTGEDAAGMSDRELAMARKHIHSLAESKAMNRAIRRLGIPQAMTEQQAAEPWVVVTLVPDGANPEMRKALIESMAPSRALLYGKTETEPPRALPNEIEAGEDTGEVVDAPVAPAPPAEPEMPPEEQATPCGLPITEDLLNAVDSKDEQRYRHLGAVIAWQGYVVKHVGQERATAIFQKLGAGFEPLTAPIAEVIGLVAAMKAEVGGGK